MSVAMPPRERLFNWTDIVARSNGFDTAEEMFRLVAQVNLAKPGMLLAFEIWKRNDGTKAGLSRLLEV